MKDLELVFDRAVIETKLFETKTETSFLQDFGFVIETGIDQDQDQNRDREKKMPQYYNKAERI